MKILLKNNESDELAFCDLGLGYLATPLRDAGHEVNLLLTPLSEESFTYLVKKFKPDVIGIKVLSSGVQNTARTIELIRRIHHCLIVIGGPHITGDPDGALELMPADYAFQGEADRSFPAFIQLLDDGSLAGHLDDIPGLVRREGGRIKRNPPDMIRNIDSLPLPAWELMPPGDHQSLVCRRTPAAPLIASRGCTDSCTFCVEGANRLRIRSVNSVMKEIRLLVEVYGVREIQFLDSNFVFSKKYLMELGQAILDAGLDIAFCAPNGTRLEAIDDDVARMLERIGFYRANIGIESGSQEMLTTLSKRLDLDILPEKVALLRHYGILVVGNFMLGFPNESVDQMRKTLELALALDLTGANFAIYTPLPGTPLYNSLMHRKALSGKNNFQGYNYVVYRNSLSELSPSALRRFRLWCIFRFLSRPRTLMILYGLLADRDMRRSLLKRIYGMYIQKILSR